jgi:thioredoxin 1
VHGVDLGCGAARGTVRGRAHHSGSRLRGRRAARVRIATSRPETRLQSASRSSENAGVPLPSRIPQPMSEHLIHVTDDSFDEDVLQSEKPVLVDYWAEWCGPCKMIAPILDEVSSEYGDKIKVAKLDVDHNQATSMKYGIRGIPTLMLFREGSIVATHVGALTKSQLTAFIDSNV